MILNYRRIGDKAGINVFPIADASWFRSSRNWFESKAYHFTGLDYEMLLCPFLLADDELLLQRPGLYFKSSLPLGGIVYFPELPTNHGRVDFLDDVAWMVESYLFQLNSLMPPSYVCASPRFHVDYANSTPNHGPHIFDDARVAASGLAREAIAALNRRYAADLRSIISEHPDYIRVTNFAETSLLAEVCSHDEFLVESKKYLSALTSGNLTVLDTSTLTKGWFQVSCTRRYARTPLSFYTAAMRESSNARGSYIGAFKSFYNVLEYQMSGEGKAKLADVLRNDVGTAKLQDIVRKIRTSAPKTSVVYLNLTNGERLSPTTTLPPITDSDPDLPTAIADRLYTKRNDALHSKKTYKSLPADHNIRPGMHEAALLDTDIALIRPIAEAVIQALGPND